MCRMKKIWTRNSFKTQKRALTLQDLISKGQLTDDAIREHCKKMAYDKLFQEDVDFMTGTVPKHSESNETKQKILDKLYPNNQKPEVNDQELKPASETFNSNFEVKLETNPEV